MSDEEEVTGYWEWVDGPDDRDWNTELHWVGWLGRPAMYRGKVDHLGIARPSDLPVHGIRRAIYDLAFGHVNGFPFRDVLYYVATRSLSESLADRVIAWEARKHGEPASKED